MNRAWPRPGSDGVARCGAHFPRASATALLSYAPASSLLEKPAGLVHRAVVADLGGTHVRVGRQVGALAIFHVGKPRRLSRSRRLDACMDRRGWLPAAIVAELLKRDARDFDVNVDPVEQRAGEALLVAADHHRAARAGMFGIAPIITRARILGSDQHEIRREGQAALGAADRDDFVFQGLPEYFLYVVTNGKKVRDSYSVRDW